MKITKPDKHYITEYYTRKGYIVTWIDGDTFLELIKRQSNKRYCFDWYTPIRDFISEVDKILANDIKENEKD